MRGSSAECYKGGLENRRVRSAGDTGYGKSKYVCEIKEAQEVAYTEQRAKSPTPSEQNEFGNHWFLWRQIAMSRGKMWKDEILA